MKISDVLRSKGTQVVTINPEETVAGLLTLLYENNIGACVVSSDGKTIEGIVSERDIVRRLHADGTGVLLGPVSRIMTSEVNTGTADDEIATLAATMTNERVRHVPIVDEHGGLTAIVSIGDIVKSRLNELQSERDQLRDYISQ